MKTILEKTKNDIIGRGQKNLAQTSNLAILNIGTILDNKYEITREIARGGMGIVYEAYNKYTHKKVAIKVILADNATPVQLKRFQKELDAYTLLSHPNVITIYDAGVYKNNYPYMVMEYIDGVDICTYVKQQEKKNRQADAKNANGEQQGRDWKLCARLIYEVALGLDYIHSQKMIHRDIKPANILVRSNGSPVIIDLGLVKFHETQSYNLTKSREITGTVEYMPIEQAQGKTGNIDARTDVYSLGLVLYELLTGKKAYSGNDIMELIYKIMSYFPPLPREIDAQIPEVLEKITIRATEKQRKNRYASMKEFANALKQYLDNTTSKTTYNDELKQHLDNTTVKQTPKSSQKKQKLLMPLNSNQVKYLHDEKSQPTKKNTDYKKQARLQWNKKHIIAYLAYFIALVLLIITTISMINSIRKEDIRLKIEALEVEKTSIDKEIGKFKTERDQLNIKINRLKDTIEKNKEELSRHRESYEQLKDTQHNIMQNIKSKNQELNIVNEKIDELKKEQFYLSQQKEIVTNNCKNLFKEKNSLEKDQKNLTISISKIKTDINYLSNINFESEINYANIEQSKLEEEVNNMQSTRQSLIDKIESYQHQINIATKQIEDSDEQIRKSENDIARLENDIESLENQSSQITQPEDPNSAYEKMNQITQIRAEIQVIRTSMQPIRDSKIKHEEERNESQRKHKEKSDELTRIVHQINNSHYDISRISQKIQNLEGKKQDLEKNKQDLEKNKQDLEETNQNLNSVNIQYDEETAKELDLIKQLNEVNNKLSDKKEEKNSLKKQINNKKTEAKQFQNQLDELNKKTTYFNSLEKQIKEKETEFRQTQDKLNQKQQQIKEKETEAKQFQEQLDELNQLLIDTNNL